MLVRSYHCEFHLLVFLIEEKVYKLFRDSSFCDFLLYAQIQMVSVEEDDLAGLEDVSSDGEDDNYEAELTDNETASTGAAAVRRPYRKRARGMD